MEDQKPPEYKVGYGRPPKHTRFRPGTSGNPKGRPRAAKNFGAVLDTILNERVPVSENGKRKKMPMIETILKQMARKAATGDHRASRLLFDMWRCLHPEGNQEPSALELMRQLGAAAAAEIEKEKAEAESDRQE